MSLSPEADDQTALDSSTGLTFTSATPWWLDQPGEPVMKKQSMNIARDVLAVTVILVVASLLMVAVGAYVAARAEADVQHSEVSDHPLRDRIHVCKYEDGSGSRLPCVWDAEHMGNGRGLSLLHRHGGRTREISHRWAHNLYRAARHNDAVLARFQH